MTASCKKGHVLVIHVYAVPGGELYLEGIVFRAACAAAYVVDKGVGQ